MKDKLFNKMLVANRSEIAIRVMNACRTLEIPSVAVYSEADVNAKHRWFADESVLIGEATPRASYLDIEKIIAAAKDDGRRRHPPRLRFSGRESKSAAPVCRRRDHVYWTVARSDAPHG